MKNFRKKSENFRKNQKISEKIRKFQKKSENFRKNQKVSEKISKGESQIGAGQHNWSEIGDSWAKMKSKTIFGNGIPSPFGTSIQFFDR